MEKALDCECWKPIKNYYHKIHFSEKWIYHVNQNKEKIKTGRYNVAYSCKSNDKNPGPGPCNTISQTDNKFLIVYRIIWEYLDWLSFLFFDKFYHAILLSFKRLYNFKLSVSLTKESKRILKYYKLKINVPLSSWYTMTFTIKGFKIIDRWNDR